MKDNLTNALWAATLFMLLFAFAGFVISFGIALGWRLGHG